MNFAAAVTTLGLHMGGGIETCLSAWLAGFCPAIFRVFTLFPAQLKAGP